MRSERLVIEQSSLGALQGHDIKKVAFAPSERFLDPQTFREEWYVPENPQLQTAKWLFDVRSYFRELFVDDYSLLWERFPYQLHYLVTLFEDSRKLLDLPHDWDGNGGEPFEEEHWQRVIQFLSDNALWLWEREHVSMPEPRIVPGPSRSIDVHWKTDTLELLLNIPEDTSLPINFYGDDYGREAVNGTLGLGHDNFWLMLWLVGRK